jgi:hypothetical protein
MHPLPPGLGRRIDLDRELPSLGSGSPTAGRVLAQYPERWLVAAPAPRLVPARGRLRRTPGGTPGTGDRVALDGDGAIVAVRERRGTVVRRAAGGAGGAQMPAANLALALVVEALPDPSARRVDQGSLGRSASCVNRAGPGVAEAGDEQSAERVEPDVIAGRDDLRDDRRRVQERGDADGS